MLRIRFWAGTVVCAAALLSACDGPTVAEPELAPRYTICDPDGNNCGPERPPPDTIVYARYMYSSWYSTHYYGPSYGVPESTKEIKLYTQNQHVSDVGSSTLTARYWWSYWYGCDPTYGPTSQQKTGTGSPLTITITVTSGKYPATHARSGRIAGTHVFVPRTGARGGGTYETQAQICH
jgi:hypothetical protein